MEFSLATAEQLPAADQSFDTVFSWSAFEHIEEPVHVALEMGRILRPGGVLMIQLWPFYYSERGGHRWPWAPEGYSHLLGDNQALERHARETTVDDQKTTAERLLMGTLNRMSLDERQRCLLVGGFIVTKLRFSATPCTSAKAGSVSSFPARHRRGQLLAVKNPSF